MTAPFSLDAYGIAVPEIIRNAAPPVLYENALRFEHGSAITSTGALLALSGEKTGRSPKDKRIVDEPTTTGNVWWGPVNVGIDDDTFRNNRTRAIDYLNTRERLYVVDGYAGWDPRYRIKVRVLCARAYHALFMHNMLIRPTPEQLADFGEPDYVLLNAGAFPACPDTGGTGTGTAVALNLRSRELVILGTEYAGEMKKGVFTIMNYLMPERGVLSMHCSATQSRNGTDTSILFGLSGTGKTTLSADPKRLLIGDDEHCWTDEGVFNIEGGCYAKMIDLSAEQEPDIWQALRFGTVQENMVHDPATRQVDYADTSITNNTRGSYPIEYIPNAAIPCIGGQPKNVILLTCDAFGVLPPVSKLTSAQAMYHFISGYTAKVAGTEMGVTDPEATFSACFGGPFLVWHPARYAELLASRIQRESADVWLVNTGWTGGAFGVGKRMSLKHTRAIIDAIHDGSLAKAETTPHTVFGVAVPTSCPGVPSQVLDPRSTWSSSEAYDAAAQKLANLFRKNFEKYADGASEQVLRGGPQI